jgi:hypothetical protein
LLRAIAAASGKNVDALVDAACAVIDAGSILDLAADYGLKAHLDAKDSFRIRLCSLRTGEEVLSCWPTEENWSYCFSGVEHESSAQDDPTAILLVAARRIRQPKAGVGTIIEVIDIETGEVSEYQLISDRPLRDTEEGQDVRVHSPLGKQLVGRRSGDVFAVQLPRITRKLRVQKLRSTIEGHG